MTVREDRMKFIFIFNVKRNSKLKQTKTPRQVTSLVTIMSLFSFQALVLIYMEKTMSLSLFTWQTPSIQLTENYAVCILCVRTYWFFCLVFPLNYFPFDILQNWTEAAAAKAIGGWEQLNTTIFTANKLWFVSVLTSATILQPSILFDAAIVHVVFSEEDIFPSSKSECVCVWVFAK